ncbi:unnamed protein product [Pieris macdunnoughi]|uniref:Uncharacterized protein n=1 Tax=Pieris macdunnoughi TaxID=345717 RepID=A0A821L0W2_9NEOP|nr:unnamed protein product [Pieris macdunnoughi]
MSLPLKRSFSTEGHASRRDWKTRLSLRSRSGHSMDALRGRRCASLRAGTSIRVDDSGRATPARVPRAASSPGDQQTPKKSNWEVIEHFSSSRSRKSPTTASQWLHLSTNISCGLRAAPSFHYKPIIERVNLKPSNLIYYLVLNLAALLFDVFVKQLKLNNTRGNQIQDFLDP